MTDLRGRLKTAASWIWHRLWHGLWRLAQRLARNPVALVLVGGLALASAIGILSARIPNFEAFGDLQGHFAAAAGIAAVAGLIARSRLWTAAAAVVLAANLATIGVRLALVETCAVQTAATGQQSLRVMTLNVWGRNRDLDAIERVVVRHQPDVLLLQELRPWHAPLLDRLRGRYRYRMLCESHDDCGIAVLSVYPLTTLRDVGNDTLMLLEVEAAVGEQELVLMTTHMQRPFHGNEQSQQFVALAEEVARMPANSLVAGDFNSALWSANLSRYVAAAGVCACNATQATWPRWLGPFGLPIDHVFLKPGLGLLSIATVGETGSDHRALLATVGLP